MNRVFAIAVLSLRASVRSKVVLSLLAILALTIVALPLSIRGDGSLGGEMQVLLTYTLGIVSFILSVVSLWAGCAAVSLEVAERQIHLVATKPVRRLEIWLGKWVGLLVLNAALLAVTGGTVYGLVQWKLRPSAQLSDERRQTLEEEILIARSEVLPDLPDVREEVDQLIEEGRATGQILPHFSRDEVAQELRVQLLTRRYTAPYGGSLEWSLQLPPDARTDVPMHLRYKLRSSEFGYETILGQWRIRSPGKAGSHEWTLPDAPDAFHSLRIPANTVGADRTLLVQYRNVESEQIASLFGPDDGLALYVPVGSFSGNLIRALLIQFAQIAFLSAIGVTAGCLFSMPVASFVALFALVLLHSLPYIDQMAGRQIFMAATLGQEAATPGVTDFLFTLLFRAMNTVIAPLHTPNPLEPLGMGHLVPWGLVTVTVGIKLLLYSGLLALIGSWLFDRRELGLPS